MYLKFCPECGKVNKLGKRFCGGCGFDLTETDEQPAPASADIQRDGNAILFGSYPQSLVTDGLIVSALGRLAGAVPTKGNPQKWTSYGYYIQGATEDYMWYIDVDYHGDRYRGVYFDAFRPSTTVGKSSSDNSFQNENGYEPNVVYWFAYEPIRWQVMSETQGIASLLCERILDSREYNKSVDNRNMDEGPVFADNYCYSDIRDWLNDTFFHAAFTDAQQQCIDTEVQEIVKKKPKKEKSEDDAQEEESDDEPQEIRLTFENHVTLPVDKDIKDASNGFKPDYMDSDPGRRKQSTDYAKCLGVFTDNDHYKGNGKWWLRAVKSDNSYYARYVECDGFADYFTSVHYTYNGVVPFIKLKVD